VLEPAECGEEEKTRDRGATEAAISFLQTALWIVRRKDRFLDVSSAVSALKKTGGFALLFFFIELGKTR
jgi:hypothetical protein